tara:strand:- start:65 stop:1444 length:1380 start_codon:yes stop_codon:yes gene_type:complete
MFKKIEMWVLYLVILLSFVFAVFFGVLVRQELVGNVKAGWFSKTALDLAEIPVNIKRFSQGVSSDLILKDRFINLKGFDGTPNSQEAYLLLSRYDGDLEEGVVELVDLTNFQVLHTWNPDINAFNDLVKKEDEFKYLNRDAPNSRSLLSNPLLMSDGSLVFHTSLTPIRKIDFCSNLVFQNTKDIFHHSIEKDKNENIWASSHLYPQALSENRVGRKLMNEGGYYDDAIVKLSPKGEIIYEKSVSQILIDNGMEARLSMIGTNHQFLRDPIHINDIQPVNYDSDYWKEGDLFLSLGHQSMVVLFRPKSGKILWKLEENIFHQHDVNILSNNEISIFNNNRKYFFPNEDVVDGHNEVLVFNFKSGQTTSYLKDSLIRENVKTKSQGRSDILINGDLFVEETNFGRTLYFNKDGSLRWSYVNRASNGNIYGVGWSRILFKPSDIKNVKKIIKEKNQNCISD